MFRFKPDFRFFSLESLNIQNLIFPQKLEIAIKTVGWTFFRLFLVNPLSCLFKNFVPPTKFSPMENPVMNTYNAHIQLHIDYGFALWCMQQKCT